MSAAIGIISGLAFVGGGWALAAYLVRKAYGQPLTDALDDTCRDFADQPDSYLVGILNGVPSIGCERGFHSHSAKGDNE